MCGESQTRLKKMNFGRGLYFTDSPTMALMYGNVLILAKVMLGECERVGVTPPPPSTLPKGYDSRAVLSSGLTLMYIITQPNQVLPYCVIMPKSENSFQRFIHPSPASVQINPRPDQPTPLTPSHSTHPASPPTPVTPKANSSS